MLKVTTISLLHSFILLLLLWVYSSEFFIINCLTLVKFYLFTGVSILLCSFVCLLLLSDYIHLNFFAIICRFLGEVIFFHMGCYWQGVYFFHWSILNIVIQIWCFNCTHPKKFKFSPLLNKFKIQNYGKKYSHKKWGGKKFIHGFRHAHIQTWR